MHQFPTSTWPDSFNLLPTFCGWACQHIPFCIQTSLQAERLDFLQSLHCPSSPVSRIDCLRWYSQRVTPRTAVKTRILHRMSRAGSSFRKVLNTQCHCQMPSHLPRFLVRADWYQGLLTRWYCLTNG